MIYKLTGAILALLIVSSASAADLVREFNGRKSTTTAAFEVQGPWLLDWRLDGDYDYTLALDITLIDAKTGAHIGRVLHTKSKGNGLKLFQQGGNYQLRISSSLGRWRIKIEQITEEEAVRYTPRRAPGSDNPFN